MALRPGRISFIVIIAALLTVVATLLLLNLTIGDKQIDEPVTTSYSVADPQFRRTMGVILGPALEPGNRVEELLDGAQIFPAMLAAIGAAERSITFETYIFWTGSIGRQFVDALVERAGQGVKVHVLLDWVGGALEESLLERMERGGVVVRWYNSPGWRNLHRLNHRTHRKLLVVDGRIGFTGGAGIADIWRGQGDAPGHWRDTHFRLQGPAVGQMQSAFIDNWMQATGDVLHGPDYLPELEETGSLTAQVFTSSPGGGSESVHLMYLLSISAARHSIRLSAAYFVPDDVSIRTLVAALRRGVKVQIILPGKYIDRDLLRRASRASWGRLLEAGAEIYEYQPSMYHVKVMVVDGLWVSAGSTNFDDRSFAINDEANLNVYDAGFAQRQVEVFEQDLKQSRRVLLQEWKQRPWSDKVLDFLASLLRSQL